MFGYQSIAHAGAAESNVPIFRRTEVAFRLFVARFLPTKFWGQKKPVEAGKSRITIRMDTDTLDRSFAMVVDETGTGSQTLIHGALCDVP